jgi:hypothetical protein
MIASVINLETDVRFDPSKWIRVGKIYKDAPVEVSDAFTDTRKLPPELQATLPGPTLSVTKFLELKFLGVLDRSTKFSTQTNDWFSEEPPNYDPLAFWTLKSMPPRWLVDELENDCPQKWLNGAQSVLDPLDKSIRLPLSALAFYSRIHALLEAQEK